MKTTLLKSVLLLALLLPAAKMLAADNKVTLTGTALCAKCTLHETDKCLNVLEVKTADGKTERYYFTAKMDHEKFCHGKTEGVTVTGVVSEKDGKKFITPESVSGK